ncbi:MAG: hypothetical protein JO222_10590 [Frankiales bacterium]|nr:hypothetical protein [Frankiales bacterium]
MRDELNRTDRIRLDRPAVAALKRSPVWRAVRATVPADVRHRLWSRAGSRRVNIELQRQQMPDELRRRVVDELRPDLERLPAYVGADFDCWGLLEDPFAR